MRLSLILAVIPVLTGCASSSDETAVGHRKSEFSAKTPASPDSRHDDSDRVSKLFPQGTSAGDHGHLHNLLRITDRVYSGGEPHGEEAFAELAELGVTTVVSVDGAIPDIEAAKKHGLRYVHIPIGYDGVNEAAGLTLTRLVREVDGPVYIHCHHGKHRGPAAAAVACVASGDVPAEEAAKILEAAGTGKNYAGLWRDVSGFVPPAEDAELPELVEIAKVDSMAAAMAKIDRASDNLKLCQKGNWTTPANHPDLVPVQEALILKEGFRESVRLLSDDYGDDFKRWMAEAESQATELEGALEKNDKTAAEMHFTQLQNTCQKCHVEFRN